MNNDFKKGIEELKGIKLSSSEKSDMFADLSKYSEIHSPSLPVRSPFLSSLFTLRNAYALAGIIVMLTTATAAFAAEGALPGERLYAVKINFTEPLRGAFAISSSAKAQWESKKLERRLAEAEKLAVKGELTEETVTEVERRIDKHVNEYDALKVKERETENKKKENVAFPSRTTSTVDDDSIEIKIKEHRAILEDIKTDKSENEREKIERLEKKLEEKTKDRKESDSRNSKSDTGRDKNK